VILVSHLLLFLVLGINRSQPPNFKRTACSSAYAIALPTYPQTAIPAERFAIAHNPLILNELLAAALRYRTAHPQTAIAHNHPNFRRMPTF
jgi:hypothetical protein